jgi:hypothetical protein
MFIILSNIFRRALSNDNKEIILKNITFFEIKIIKLKVIQQMINIFDATGIFQL